MINLFDAYDEATRDLHHSLLKAGYTHPTVVIDDNGFLPEGVYSPYGFFLGEPTQKKPARYFNQVDKPALWEIIGSGTDAAIYDKGEKRARIFYAKVEQARIVRTVEWLDNNQTVRSIDYYNQYGRKYAHTIFDAAQQAVTTTYYTVEGREGIVENHLTDDLLVHDQGKVHVFRNKIDFLKYAIERMGFSYDQIYYNRLSLPFSFVYQLKEAGSDVLFWQEPIHEAIPGNMQAILRGETRTRKILVQNKQDYQRLVALLAAQQTSVEVAYLGYDYDFKQANNGSNQALIMTNSDQIEQLTELVTQCPTVVFHIAAVTEMSEHLMRFGNYPNVQLYPNIAPKKIASLYQQSAFYLDINYGNELNQALRTAFDHQLVIFAFHQTQHNPTFIGPENRWDKAESHQLASALTACVTDKATLAARLDAQLAFANLSTSAEYRQALS